MGQLDFHKMYNANMTNQRWSASHGGITYTPFNIEESISWKTINAWISNNTGSVSIHIGLYSLNGSTLSLANSVSGITSNNINGFLQLTSTSANQNLTPGTWFFALLVSTSGTHNFSFMGQSGLPANNAFPGGFMGGRMTDTTNAFPAAYSTSNLDVTGSDANPVPIILLTA